MGYGSGGWLGGLYVALPRPWEVCLGLLVMTYEAHHIPTSTCHSRPHRIVRCRALIALGLMSEAWGVAAGLMGAEQLPDPTLDSDYVLKDTSGQVVKVRGTEQARGCFRHASKSTWQQGTSAVCPDARKHPGSLRCHSYDALQACILSGLLRPRILPASICTVLTLGTS